ncbi:hypothetical protein [Granulicella sp. dw_53]|uniref:hypothetical protein n=1 Tax=Granulicella sp. dw_53 TaxID=2719792 RepID=UPI001BD1C46B|nr:hypothetical protein [Granulicella sp. dw_53]
MPVLGRGREEEVRYISQIEDALLPQEMHRRAETRISFDEGVRHSCGSVECVSGWMRPWRSRRRPVFEGRWGCSGRCVLAMVRLAVRREAGERRVEEGLHRHRVPLGLVMLAQRWITHSQLQVALQAQQEAGFGRIGEWLISACGVEAEHVTRGLSLQWNCPVLSAEGFEAREMALVMPRRFIEDYGLVPLRVAGSRLLYLGCEDRLNASLAYAVEQMSGLRVQSGLVQDAELKAVRSRLLETEAVPVAMEQVADEDAMAARITARLEQKRPLAACLVRLHQYYWLRMWLESGTRGVFGSIPRSAEDMQDYLFTASPPPPSFS